MKDLLIRLVRDFLVLRALALRGIRKLQLGSYEQRVRMGAVQRPHYGYCVYNAAVLARKLGCSRISVLEFGVAGGNGLVNLEYHAQQVSKSCSIDIEVYGFDAADGLPEPLDYRDLPYHWQKGFFKMDVTKLRARLKNAKLVLGDVRTTANTFFEKYNPAPIGAIVYDLDFYSSTASALNMLDAGEEHYLPRVFCYFDDVIGTEMELYNDFSGQRLAINEFNQNHTDKKLGRAYHLLSRQVTEPWYHQIWICHLFFHSQYNEFISQEDQQLSCR